MTAYENLIVPRFARVVSFRLKLAELGLRDFRQMKDCYKVLVQLVKIKFSTALEKKKPWAKTRRHKNEKIIKGDFE